MKSAAVAIPLHQLPLANDEELSLRVLREVLGTQVRFFVVPERMDMPAGFLRGERVIRFPEKFFTYPLGYNRLLMSGRFFKAFTEFNHVLIYQLDCLVFRDELDAWSSRDYDYVGPPWRDDFGDAPGSAATWKVGNGGFSLRKISTARRILAKRVERGSYFAVPPIHHPRPGFMGWLVTNVRKRLKQHLNLWTVEDELENYDGNEDRFWALDVMKIAPDYKKPDVDEALRFGFETAPAVCLERTHGQIPFGCHAWAKHDRNFWEKVLANAQ